MKRLIASVVAGAVLLGITSAAPLPKDAAKSLYFPTKVGAKWVYEWKLNDGTIKTIEEVVTHVEKNDDVFIVTVARLKDGKVHYYCKWNVSRHGLTWIEYVAEGQSFRKPWHALNLSIEPGQIWETKRVTKQLMTVRKPERVSVPAGVYEAICVEERAEGISAVQATRWYAPGLGMVKWEQEGLKATLKSFTPGTP